MREGPPSRGEALAVVALVVLAAVLRFMNLPTRGTWDADQGTDMLVLWRMANEGTWPLLGPMTSIGDFHHGVLYYYLLAPAAFVSGADPLWVVGFLALAGVAAVGVVWWLGRAIGGPIAGLVAAGLMAVSAAAIEESTFIWNPNVIALSSAVSVAAAWRAWTTERARWWIVVAGAQAVTMHGHVLGSVMLVPLAAWLAMDARRRGGSELGRRRVVWAGLAGLTVIAVSYVPLLVHELQSDLSETGAAVDFLLGGGREDGPSLVVRALVVPLRMLSWPLTALVTAQPIAAVVAAIGVAASLWWRGIAAPRPERTAARWMAATLVWAAVALTLGASSLGTVVPGLPNDHYHAFLDPLVFVAVGLGVAGLWRERPGGLRVANAAAVGIVALLVALNVLIWPPAVAPDGGYPAAEAASRRLLDEVPGRYRLDGLPTLKNENAYAFPLTRLGRPPGITGDLVILCDRLLEPIIGAACDGPAEDARAAEVAPGASLVARFPASPRTVVSVYR